MAISALLGGLGGQLGQLPEELQNELGPGTSLTLEPSYEVTPSEEEESDDEDLDDLNDVYY